VKKELQLAVTVNEILDVIKNISPGKSVELRIPPYGAIQCVAGSNHRRGTPPNKVEMNGQTLIRLINEPSLWSDLCESGEVRASGLLSDLSNVFSQAAIKYRA
jgi:hypothetical protein